MVTQASQAAAQAAVESFKTSEAARIEAEKQAETAKQLQEQGKFKELSETQATKIASLEAQIAQLQGGSLRDRIANEFGFTGENAALANAITGSTEAEMRQSAEGLKAFKKATAAPPPNLNQGPTGPTTPGAPPKPETTKEQAKTLLSNRDASPFGLKAAA